METADRDRYQRAEMGAPMRPGTNAGRKITHHALAHLWSRTIRMHAHFPIRWERRPQSQRSRHFDGMGDWKEL